MYYIYIYRVYHISLETTWILSSFLAPFIDFLPGLHEAVAADSIEAAKYLLAHGCLLNATDSMQDELLDAKPSCHWIGLRENLQETMVFTIKYRVFL